MSNKLLSFCKQQSIRIFVICFYFLLLVGCGTKGELYIPEEKYPQSQLYKYKDEITDQKQLA
jgi:predicted small lipoprotein YifL